MVNGRMTKDIHPAFFDIVPSVANVIVRRFKNVVPKEDVLQECWAWALAKNSHFFEDLNEPNDEKRVQNEKRVAWQMRRAAERFARKEKAFKLGYETNDETFYETTTIAMWLPIVISSVINDTPLENMQEMVDDGQPRKPSAPAESGNLLAMLIDIKKAYELLDVETRSILENRYLHDYTLSQIAQWLEVSVSTADRRCVTSLNKLQELLGGGSPYS